IKIQGQQGTKQRHKRSQLSENRMNPSRLNRSHLRFTAEEYQRLVEDAKTYGDSIPNLIKAVYFKKKLPPMKYMHLAEDRKKGVTDCLTDGMSWLQGSTGNLVPIRRGI